MRSPYITSRGGSQEMISPNINNQTNLQMPQQGGIIQTFFVNLNGGGRNSALNYPIAAGYEAFLLDEESKMFFIKKNNGMSITLREFKYDEVTSEPVQVSGTNPINFDPSKYVTKDDFNVLVEEIKKLQNGRDKGHHYNNRNNRRNRNEKTYDE